MLMPDIYSVSQNGHFMIEGCDAVALAKEYGTPLYVMSETALRQNMRDFTGAIQKGFGERAMAAYASKALSCKEVIRIVKDEDMGLDVVSQGELYTAMSIGFPAEKIYFHGNNKSEADLRYAMECIVGRIVVDNLYELRMLNETAKTFGRRQKILFRIKPGVEAHTHDFMKTGGIDSKFGLALENGEAMRAIEEAIAMENLDLVGVHCHIGSQILQVEPFCEAAQVMIGLIAEIRDRFGAELNELNLGGGYGIEYIDGDNPPEPAVFIERVANVVKGECSNKGMAIPFVTFEPGRSVVGSAGVTLYTVGSIKTIENVRTYLAVDGGMADNPRYALYQADYTALVANRAADRKDFTVTIAGKCCESGDFIQEHTKIQMAEPGDILAVLSTGAYNYSMSSNYNRLPRPAMVMVKGEDSRLIVKRETVEDVVRNDI